MDRNLLPISAFPAWAKLNNIELNGVVVSTLQGSKGSGVVATQDLSEDNAILMTVPQELLLSIDSVWTIAKSDRHLRAVLEAVGDYARTARGAILIFLLMQIKSHSTNGPLHLGAANSWTEYVKFLPAHVPLPTFWGETDRGLLRGTSLKAALDAKLHSLDKEFVHLRDSIQGIDWCRHWLDDGTAGQLTFNDWKQVDAMYRSRALDLPGTGHAMVPCIDMANHASGDNTVALYDTDADGNGILVLRDGKTLKAGDEVTITYGDEKGACEMLFSYGFLEESMTSARELFLDIDIPNDDPLKLAKKTAFTAAPGFRLHSKDDTIAWDGLFVWLSCVNEEDGLEFHVLQNNDGEKELKASWRGKEVIDISDLANCIKVDPSFDIFRLRAVAVLQARVEKQLIHLESSKEDVEITAKETSMNIDIRNNALKLRDLEETLLLHAYKEFEEQKETLFKSNAVQEYLNPSVPKDAHIHEDDFA